MTQIAFDHRFPSALAKRLRQRLKHRGVELKQTEVLEDIAGALGWRSDALMHALKTQTPAKAESPAGASGDTSAKDNAGRSPEVEKTLEVLLRACPENTAREVVDRLLVDGWELGIGDDLQFWRKTLVPDDAQGPEVEVVLTFGERLAVGDPSEAKWELIEQVWWSGDSTAQTWANNTLDEALKMASGVADRAQRTRGRGRAKLSDNATPPGFYSRGILDHDGEQHAGVVYGTPVRTDDGSILLEENFVILDLAPDDKSAPERGRWLLIIGNQQHQSDELTQLEPLLAEFLREEWGH
ncbi:hypothetical protein CKO28_06260 [Rhodovibrio sodomensis]|uniref:DUF4132 domain-containing protein n=1 Tax=Rhodovibrio sodomensis TaxID=1088 RepID=A0ABS1DB00_9PROT|nr:hypothetical protein [Rhodovibrio sodomensis]MBK1667636.1 hypothetical protein [Rhodovibrio sodomensis]